MHEGIHDIHSELLQGDSAWAAMCPQTSEKSIKNYACGGKSVLEPGYIPHNVVLTPQEFRSSECTYAAAEVSQSAPIN